MVVCVEIDMLLCSTVAGIPVLSYASHSVTLEYCTYLRAFLVRSSHPLAIVACMSYDTLPDAAGTGLDDHFSG